MDIQVKPKVSIIIVNYNSSSLINNCLESVIQHTKDIPFEVIIVDNATECLSEKITFAGKDNVKLLQLEENVGFGLANNAGSEVAEGDYIFCLNPDTLLLNNAIKILSDFLDSRPACGACGGNIFDMDGNPAMSFRRMEPGALYDLNELMHHLPGRIAHGKNREFNFSGKPMKVFYVTGADLMIKKELFEELGGFSSEFFMYYEETDLCKRIYKNGKSVWSVPQAKIIHLENGCFDDRINDRRIRMIEQGRVTYNKRNLSLINRTLSDFFYKIFLTSRARLVRNSKKKDYFQRRLKQFCSLTEKK